MLFQNFRVWRAPRTPTSPGGFPSGRGRSGTPGFQWTIGFQWTTARVLISLQGCVRVWHRFPLMSLAHNFCF